MSFYVFSICFNVKPQQMLHGNQRAKHEMHVGFGPLCIGELSVVLKTKG